MDVEVDVEVVEATSEYFESISNLLSDIQDVDRDQVLFGKKVYDQLDLLITDVRFLEMFSLLPERWDYTCDDEESMENLRSIFTYLQLIWPKELKASFDSLRNRLVQIASATLPDEKWMQDFHSATFELETKIQQTKGLVEGWTQFLMRSSVQYKPSTFSGFSRFLSLLLRSLTDFYDYKAAEIVPLKKQIDILRANILFMDESLYRVDCMALREKMLPFLNFIGDFANSATCLTCLYWSKESNEEIANEMITVLFDMMHKFIPFSSDITALYTDFLKSYHYPSDSILLGEALESFVNFFFVHLAIILKDDYLILRDRLIFLFTFLTDPNTQEEDLIRNQIYALLREEDAYLLLPFDEMKKDFSDKKMLLNDCMIKIDITVAKVRQLYYGFSHSWIKLEVEKMEYISVHKELYWIEKHAWWADPVIDQLHLYGMELRFLRVFLLCFAACDDSDKEIKMRLRSLIASFQEIWEKEEEKSRLAYRLHAIRGGGISRWHPLASELEEKIQLSKLEIKARWVNLVHWSPLTSYEILKFLDSILKCLNDLVSYRASEIVSFKKQIETLEEKLAFLKNFLKLASSCIHSKELEEFKLFVQVFVNDAMCLTFLYWAKDTNDTSASETNNMLSHMLQKIKPATPHVARLYFGTLNAIYAQRSDSFMFGQTASTFIDFFLEDPVIPLKNDFQILRDEIVFLLSFLNDPPNQNAEEVICSQIDVLFWEGVYGLVPFDDMEGDFFDKRVLLSDFMMKIEMINGNIRRIYGKFPDPSVYNFPKIISPRFLDNLIQDLINLTERMISDQKYAPFAKYKIVKIEEELVSLRPFFNYIFDLQSELSKTWLEVVDFVHLTEHVINSCISSWFVFDHPIWYHMAHLSDVVDRINDLKTKLETIKENTMYNARCPPRSTSVISTFSEQARPSEIIETFVGFEDEVEKIMGMLTRGSTSLDIVSIVGMGGLGKTTLAKKVYDSSLVKCNFNVLAFCSVSQDHNTRRLLLDVIRDITGDDKRWLDMTDDDLAHKLRKSLSRRKFLIVLDDIWNASAWNDVKSSFPDDKNGSRVMLTTRSHEVADKCKFNYSPYQLRFMSEVESWELLQKKVFHNVISPPYLYEVGKRIAKNCKGLPLAVAVIAGLLARTEKSLSWWSEVSKRVVSYLFDEGCMRILELSYNHLPETLKPCLLYLGAFLEDERIRVKKVILLWIAEGFVQESKTKCIEDVAKEYLHDLLDRNLIIVSERSSNSEIKEIRVHDLIHDLCLTKCREANFFQLNHKIASSSSPDLSINNHCRVSLRNHSHLITVAGSSVSNVRSLLLFSKNFYDELTELPLRKLRLVQVLDLNLALRVYGMKQLSSLIHLRHICANLLFSVSTTIPQSICNILNIGSLMLNTRGPSIHLPETFWRMKSLRHVKIKYCILKFSDGQEHEAYPKLDKVVSFSNPEISTEKDVQQLLQRLPAVRKMSCHLKKSPGNDGESIEILDFHRKLESLKLSQSLRKRQYLCHFPPTLKKLTLNHCHLLWTDISAIAELHCLEVLKLRDISIQETRLEMEDVSFQNLKFLELNDRDLVEWNASIESLPCLEQLVIKCCNKLEELPSCFGEISTLKRIEVLYSSKVLKSSAFRIQEEQMELGIKVDVLISE